jgi:hypothetical protein
MRRNSLLAYYTANGPLKQKREEETCLTSLGLLMEYGVPTNNFWISKPRAIVNR